MTPQDIIKLLQSESMVKVVAHTIDNVLTTDGEETTTRNLAQTALSAVVEKLNMGGVFGVGQSSDLKPEALGSSASDKDDNLASPAKQPSVEELVKKTYDCYNDYGFLDEDKLIQIIRQHFAEKGTV